MKQTNIFTISCEIIELDEGDYKCHSHDCCWIDYMHKQPFKFKQCPVAALYDIYDILATFCNPVEALNKAQPYGEVDV